MRGHGADEGRGRADQLPQWVQILAQAPGRVGRVRGALHGRCARADLEPGPVVSDPVVFAALARAGQPFVAVWTDFGLGSRVKEVIHPR